MENKKTNGDFNLFQLLKNPHYWGFFVLVRWVIDIIYIHLSKAFNVKNIQF